MSRADKMERASNYDSIKSRERNMFGTFSFVSPVVPGQDTEMPSGREHAAGKRREQILGAQRNHRKRTKDYMNALEREVLRLRAERESLSHLAANWERIALALIGPVPESQVNSRQTIQFGPGVFAWTVTDLVPGAPDSPKQLLWQLPQPQQSISLSHFGIHDAQAPALLQNFHENIIPSLNIAEATNDGYAKYILPLALSSKMVLSSLLAGSASHVQLSRGKNMTIHHLEYRSTAFTELQQASRNPQPDSAVSLTALSTVLGLLIDDMITYSKDFAVLLNLAGFWIQKDCLCNHGPKEKAMRRFLLDQIQMMKTLVHPLYQFDMKSLPLGDSSQSPKADNQLAMITSPSKLYQIFLALETATAQACEIYKLTSATTSPQYNLDGLLYSTDVDVLLDKLQSTVSSIPPFALGETSLIWVYHLAASRSQQIHHRTFFVSRLAELLRRIGHENVNEIIAKTNMV